MLKRQFNVRSLLWLTGTFAAFLGAVTTSGVWNSIDAESLLDLMRVIGWWNCAVMMATLPTLAGILDGRPWRGVQLGVACFLITIAVGVFLTI